MYRTQFLVNTNNSEGNLQTSVQNKQIRRERYIWATHRLMRVIVFRLGTYKTAQTGLRVGLFWQDELFLSCGQYEESVIKVLSTGEKQSILHNELLDDCSARAQCQVNIRLSPPNCQSHGKKLLMRHWERAALLRKFWNPTVSFWNGTSDILTFISYRLTAVYSGNSQKQGPRTSENTVWARYQSNSLSLLWS